MNQSPFSIKTGVNRRNLMMAGSSLCLPWLSACGGGGNSDAGDVVAVANPFNGAELPSVAGSATGAESDIKRALSWTSEIEAVLNRSQSPSWAYYTDPTDQRWYISHVGLFQSAADIYSLGFVVENQASWWTVALRAATGSASTRKLTAAAGLDSNTSTTFWDAGRRVNVTNTLILNDRRLIQGATVPMKWWFFKAPNGIWYIVLDPAYGGSSAPAVRRFEARDNQYVWPTLDLAGTRTLLEWEGNQPKFRFTPSPGFAAAVEGRTIDRDGFFGGQCVDLMHHYLDVALGIPFRSTQMAGNAFPIYQNAPSTATYTSGKYGNVTFNKMPRTTSNRVPLPGDIVFWRNPDPGHVAIVVDADADNIYSIDQNWFDSNTTVGSPAARVTHANNNNVVGWLRPTW